jgi:hypothetical protein
MNLAMKRSNVSADQAINDVKTCKSIKDVQHFGGMGRIY